MTTPIVEAVSASSPKNVWALGLGGVWLHFDGTTWTSGQLGRAGRVLPGSVLALSKTNVWALGATTTPSGRRPYAAHFDGAGWTATRVPGTSPISSSSAVSSGDVWAVEGAGVHTARPGRGALVHWSGGAWHLMTVPTVLARSGLGSVVAGGDKDIWVGGAVKNSRNGTTEAVGHWNGTTWAVSVLPAAASSRKYAVTGLSADGHGGLWAVANCLTCQAWAPAPAQTRVWHESVGMWKRAAVTAKHPVSIFDMALAPGTTSVWGAGYLNIFGDGNALIALDGNAPH
jgi:hypothetical protein